MVGLIKMTDCFRGHGPFENRMKTRDLLPPKYTHMYQVLCVILGGSWVPGLAEIDGFGIPKRNRNICTV